jgi:hypothetical protein
MSHCKISSVTPEKEVQKLQSCHYRGVGHVVPNQQADLSAQEAPRAPVEI